MEDFPKIFYPNNTAVKTEIINFQNFKSGFTESFFEYKLDKYFRGHIQRNIALKADWEGYPYQPDYVLSYTEHNLYIDIEIDEPYAYTSGNPIHFNDTKRDDYFLNNGWSIIRFAEEQICKYPEMCCKIIAEHVRDLSGENIWIEGFHQMGNISLVKSWNETEARKMASVSYRNTYLHLLQTAVKMSPDISILADGIFLNQELTRTQNTYNEIWPNKILNKPAKISLLVEYFSKYFPYYKVIKNGNPKICVEFVIYISNHHSFYNFSFDTDLIEIGNYIINIYYVRTQKIICFEISEYIESKSIKNLLLIADDPAYTNLFKNLNIQEIILARKKEDSHMMLSEKHFDINNPLAKSLGLKENEI